MTFVTDPQNNFDLVFDAISQKFVTTKNNNERLNEIVYFALFTNIRANNTEVKVGMQNSGYIGEMFLDASKEATGSKLWLINTNNIDNAKTQVQARVREALQFLINTNVISGIKCDILTVHNNDISFIVNLIYSDNTTYTTNIFNIKTV